MADISGLNLKQPQQIDWDNFNPGSKYQAPPPALGADGKSITYFGQCANPTVDENTDEGFLQFQLDPITIVKSGQGADGYTIRFTRASVKNFTDKQGNPKNVNKIGTFLRAAGIQAKPQQNNEYISAVNQTKGKVFPFTIDWYGKNKETGEVVRGYLNFPEDPDRPGQRKAILKAGDTYTDKDGVTQTLKGDVLFANAVVRYFVDSKK